MNFTPGGLPKIPVKQELLQVQTEILATKLEIDAAERLEANTEIDAEILHTKVELSRLERPYKKLKVAAAAKTSLPLRFSNDKRHHVSDLLAAELPPPERRAMKAESSEDHVMTKMEVDDEAEMNFYYLGDALQNLANNDALKAADIEPQEEIEDIDEFCKGCNERIGQLDFKRTGKKKQNIWHLSCLARRYRGKTAEDRFLPICPRCNKFVNKETEEFVITKSNSIWHRVCKDTHAELLQKKDVQCPGCRKVRSDDPMPDTWIRRNSGKLWCQGCYFDFSGSNRWVENIAVDDDL